jgi:hypothetical protein
MNPELENGGLMVVANNQKPLPTGRLMYLPDRAISVRPTPE